VRLAIRLTVVLLLGSAVLLSLQALVQVQRLGALNQRDLADDLVLLSGALGDAVDALWRTSGRDAAQRYLAEADVRREHIRVRLQREGAAGASAARQSAVPATRVSGRPLVPVVHDDTVSVRVAVPAPEQGDPALSFEVSRSLAASRAWIRRAAWEQGGVAAIVVLATGALALLLGVFLVGRRVERLSGQARRVGRGDYARNDDRGRDELGALASELNHMVDLLEQSSRQVKEERLARSETLEQLRHADRLSTVGRLASSVAHEIGTPLNVVAGRAQLILEGEDPAQNASIIVRQADQMVQTIRQLLDFSRKAPAGTDMCEIASVLAQAKTLMEPLADARKVRIETRVPSDLWAVAASGRLLQVLTNLMVNGIQSMPDGGELSVRAAQLQVDRPPDRRVEGGCFVRIDVGDTGSGIDDETLSHVFEPFFTTKKRQEGTGLGLSVCQDIVREHGGWIEVESNVGQGSCFSLFWPVGSRGAA
jgi:two-component system NtrC family sensor kinase